MIMWILLVFITVSAIYGWLSYFRAKDKLEAALQRIPKADATSKCEEFPDAYGQTVQLISEGPNGCILKLPLYRTYSEWKDHEKARQDTYKSIGYYFYTEEKKERVCTWGEVVAICPDLSGRAKAYEELKATAEATDGPA